MKSDFLALLHTVQEIRKLYVLDAKTDNEKMIEAKGDSPDRFSIDVAELLGSEAKQQVITFAAPNAATVYRITENAGDLFKHYRETLGWPQSLCHDVAMLVSCHVDPMPPHGHALIELYQGIVQNRFAYTVWTYLIERLARAWPHIARPELVIEIALVDHRRKSIAEGDRLNDENDEEIMFDMEKRRREDTQRLNMFESENEMIQALADTQQLLVFDDQLPN